MGYDIRDRNFLTLLDFSPQEIRFLLKLARDLKAAKYGGYEQPRLRGKNIALIFEKTSTRTRVAFEVAAYDLGAHVTYLGPAVPQIGHKESMKDTARVLGRIYDGIEYRGFGQDVVEELADYAGVPVWNGLTDEFHPTQILADVLTMSEHSDKPLPTSRTAILGDAPQQHGRLAAGRRREARHGRPALRAEAPLAGEELSKRARRSPSDTGARICLTETSTKASRASDFLYTDVWVSMGEDKSVWDERIKLLARTRSMPTSSPGPATRR